MQEFRLRVLWPGIPTVREVGPIKEVRISLTVNASENVVMVLSGKECNRPRMSRFRHGFDEARDDLDFVVDAQYATVRAHICGV